MDLAAHQAILAFACALRDAGVIDEVQMDEIGRSMVRFFKKPHAALSLEDLEELRGLAHDIRFEPANVQTSPEEDDIESLDEPGDDEHHR